MIVFDSNVSDDQLIADFYGTDNDRVGEIAGEKMAETLEQQGDILIFAAQGKTQSTQKRVDGFKNVIAEYPEMNILEEIYADEVEDMNAAMQEALKKHPEADGVYCTNADVADLYLSLEQTDEQLPVMIGVDATTKQQAAVKDGREFGIVSQDPYEMGYQTILAAAHMTDSDGVQKSEETDLLEPAWIDSSNIDNPEYSNFIYKK